MSLDLFLALLVFAFVTSVTPGPNNTMVLASGVNFGVRATVPHMLGIGIGFSLMVFVVGLGLGRLFATYPFIFDVLRVAGALYMLWLAWKIAHSAPPSGGESKARPISFVQAALFQWVNPKAWIMAVTANATYAIVGQPVASALTVACAFAVCSVPSNLTWVCFGAALRKLLQSPLALRIFNISMAVLLVASLVPLLWT